LWLEAVANPRADDYGDRVRPLIDNLRDHPELIEFVPPPASV